MPNGGSDCCGTCWFNARNKGEAGYNHADPRELNFCKIRRLAIDDPFWTYCGNHPHRRPEPDPIPIGPVFISADEYPYRRKQWQLSPDTEEVRWHLLDLLQCISAEPLEEEYPAGLYVDELVVWQLGEFRERQAIDELRRIAAFSADTPTGPFDRTNKRLVAIAREALAELGESAE